ncbi:MAG: hypothetical protein ACLQIB_16305 [Isosphaeraceae bacterium]
MLGTSVFLEFIKADSAACVHILNSPSDALEHTRVFGDLAKLLVGGSVLNNQFGLAVDSEDKRLTGLL